MNSAVAEIRSWVEKEEHFTRWMEHPSSSIIHHENACCEEARLWFLAYARSMEIRSLSQYKLKSPFWLSQLFSWGPSDWPIAWCEVVKKKIIDCGVFAALAREVFRAQGHEAHPAQALLSYNEVCTDHWKLLWRKEVKEKSETQPERYKNANDELAQLREVRKRRGQVFHWVGNRLVYHELCLIEQPGGFAKIYDSTWGNWYEPRARAGFGAVLAIRTECPRLLQWGDKWISHGEWISL